MKFSVNPKDFHNALSKAIKLVGTIANLVIVVNEKAYLFATSSSSVAAQVFFDAKIEKKGFVSIDATILQGLIKTYKTELSFYSEDGLLYFKSKNQKDYKGSIVTLDADREPKLKVPEGGVNFSKEAAAKLDSLVPVISVIDSKLKQEVPISFVIDKKEIEVGAASFVEAAYVKIKTKVKADNVEFTLPPKTFGIIKSVAAKTKYAITFNDKAMYADMPDIGAIVKMPLFQSEMTMETIKSAMAERKKEKSVARIMVDSSAMINALSSLSSLAVAETNYVELKVSSKGLIASLHGDKGNLTQIIPSLDENIKKSEDFFMFYPITLLNAFKRIKDTSTTLVFTENSLLISGEVDSNEVNFLIMAVA